MDWGVLSMKFLNKVRGTLDTATRKSQDALEINKLNGQIKKHEGELDKLYRAVGEKIYQDPDVNRPETKNYVDVQVKNIQHVQHQIDNLQTKVHFLKDLIECDACKKILPIRTKFCPNCGRNITELAKTVSKILAIENTQE